MELRGDLFTDLVLLDLETLHLKDVLEDVVAVVVIDEVEGEGGNVGHQLGQHLTVSEV